MKTTLSYRCTVCGLCRAFTIARPLQMQGCADAAILTRSQFFMMLAVLPVVFSLRFRSKTVQT
ncbi:hypothetical protein ACYBUK_25585, partial [Klebsiella pneumoniae]